MFNYFHSLLLLSLIGSMSFAIESEEDWKAKYERVFPGDSKDIVDPKEVVLIERLFETIPADIKSYNEHKDTLEYCLELSRINESKCTSKDIMKYSNAVYYTALNLDKWLPYLRHFRLKLVEFCETVLPQRVSDAAFQVDLESAAEAKAFNAFFTERVDKSEKEVPKHELVEVALAYMKAKRSIPFCGLQFTRSQRTKAWLKFVDAYEVTFKFCKSLSKEFDRLMELHRAIIKYDSWKMDSKTELWLQMSNTCQTFNPDFATFKFDLFTAYKNEGCVAKLI